MFSISTIHLAIDMSYDFDQFLYHNAAVDAPEVFNRFGDPRLGVFIMLMLINVRSLPPTLRYPIGSQRFRYLQCIIGDIIVMWRVWALWSRSWKVTSLPGIFWIASIGTISPTSVTTRRCSRSPQSLARAAGTHSPSLRRAETLLYRGIR